MNSLEQNNKLDNLLENVNSISSLKKFFNENISEFLIYVYLKKQEIIGKEISDNVINIIREFKYDGVSITLSSRWVDEYGVQFSFGSYDTAVHGIGEKIFYNHKNYRLVYESTNFHTDIFVFSINVIDSKKMYAEMKLKE